MYIEMVDETGQVSEEILKQTQEILEFAAQKTGKEKKEMAGRAETGAADRGKRGDACERASFRC